MAIETIESSSPAPVSVSMLTTEEYKTSPEIGLLLRRMEAIRGSDSGNDKKVPLPGSDFNPAASDVTILKAQELLLSSFYSQAKGVEAGIQTDAIARHNADQKAVQQLEDAIRQMQKAKDAGLFGEIFGWMGVGAEVIAAVIMVSTGIGAAPGALMLASATLSLGNQIFNQAGGMDLIQNAFGDKGTEIFSYTTVGITALLSIGSLGAGAAASIPAISSRLPAFLFQSTAAATGGNLGTVVIAGRIVSQLFGATSQLGGGASVIAAGVIGKDAADAQGAQKDTEAVSTKIQYDMDAAEQNLKNIFSQITKVVQQSMELLGESYQAKAAISRNTAA